MFSHRTLILLTGILVSFAFSAGAGPNLGQDAPPELIAAWDISVGPDGTNLPSGGGSAKEGAVVYEEKCLSCHGPEGSSGEGLADKLVGGIGTLNSGAPVKTVGSFWPFATTLFDYVRRAMPYDAPLSLTNDEVYAVSAYILAKNGIIEENERMDAKTIPAVVMPNQNGFINKWAPKQ